MAGLLAKKLEMTRVVKDNKLVPVTLLQVPTLKVIAIKTQETDGYDAIVLGIAKDGVISELKEGKKTLDYNDFSQVKEVPFSDADKEKYQVGGDVTLDVLEGIEKVEIVGVSKGKGFAGAMKRWNFAGGPKTHGSKFHRALGSIGTRKPRRTHKGKKMHGHMGLDQITLKKVSVELVNKDLSVIGVKGPVPGSRNSLVQIKF